MLGLPLALAVGAPLVTGCSVFEDSKPSVHDKDPINSMSAKEAFPHMRDLLVRAITELPKQFPDVHWDQKIELTIAGGIDANDPVDLSLSAWSRNSVLSHWSPMVEALVTLGEPHGFEDPHATQHGGAGNRITRIIANAGRRQERNIVLESYKSTNLSIDADGLKNDAPAVQEGVVWRNGKNVMEPYPG